MSFSRWFLSKIKSRWSPSKPPLDYDQWSRQALIDRLRLLDNHQSPSPPPLPPTKRPFTITDYPRHRIALKVAYQGWNYLGFAAQKDTTQTVEHQLFEALDHCKLISPGVDNDYSRCGRTDKGVSGLGQVIALNVRRYNTPIMPYVETLNRVLPQDIRIVAWSPVAPTFNARFDCVSRTYRYMFLRDTLDLDAMRLAASHLIGIHDFRNFCKLDPSKQTNHTRHILSIDIVPCSSKHQYEVVIKGKAFLWHQVRYIMSILFLVGQGHEPASIVPELLNINHVSARPDYPLASALPLLLHHCEFSPGALNWQQSQARPYRLHQHWHDLGYEHDVRAWHYHACLQDQDQDQQQDQQQASVQPASTVTLGAGRYIRTTKYRPLLTRARAESEQLKRQKYHAKLARKNKTTSLVYTPSSSQ
ncbi:hypothetical protein [Absidia glauca]|uniref:tRNA pseudouridine synthase n=1 Tax=Absidia glauca TaxID=4829 RepID=A0A168T8B0_ABSGL|nr:hypothetical protein [Absidia glauca]